MSFHLLYPHSNRHLKNYSKEKIIEYVNSVSADVQKKVEESITFDDPEADEVMKLANFMSSITNRPISQEVPLVLKLKSQSDAIPEAFFTQNVNFV